MQKGWLFGLGILGMLFLLKTEVKAISISGGCGWCGMSCQRVDSKMVCADVMPPEGLMCVVENGQCVIKNDDETPDKCVSYTDCGVHQKCEDGICMDVPCIDKPACMSSNPPCMLDLAPWQWFCPDGWCKSDDNCGVNEKCTISTNECDRLICPLPPVSECSVEVAVPHQCPRYENVADGTECSLGVCKSGECVEKKMSCPTDKPEFVKGNANCDDKIDLLDFAIWRNNYLVNTNDLGDFNLDGKTDLLDFAIWRSGYLKS